MDKKLDKKIKELNNVLAAVKKKFTPANQRKFLHALDTITSSKELAALAVTIESEYKAVVVKNLHLALKRLRVLQSKKRTKLVGFSEHVLHEAKAGKFSKAEVRKRTAHIRKVKAKAKKGRKE